MMEPVIAVAMVGAATTIGSWFAGRSKNKADVAKLAAEAELTHAKAQQLALANSVEKVVSDKFGEVQSTLTQQGVDLAKLTDAVHVIRHEVMPNHGSSIKDAVGRLELGQDRVEGYLEVAAQDRANMHTQLDALDARVRENEIRQREREVEARREHEDFRAELNALKP